MRKIVLQNYTKWLIDRQQQKEADQDDGGRDVKNAKLVKETIAENVVSVWTWSNSEDQVEPNKLVS